MIIANVKDLFECFHDKYFYEIHYYDSANKKSETFYGENNEKKMNLKFLEDFGHYVVREFAYYIDGNKIYLDIYEEDEEAYDPYE